MVVSEAYEAQRQKVLAAQAARVANKDEQSPGDTHPLCEAERNERQVLEDMPEHKEAQSKWVSFLAGLIGSSRTYRKVDSQFDIVDDVTC